MSGHDISLLQGTFPVSMQVITGFTLIAAIGLRSKRWLRVWLPVAVCTGAALAISIHWYVDSQGWTDNDNPVPPVVWMWTALVGVAATVLAAGWRQARWWRRGTAIVAVPLAVLSSALTLNQWTGYVSSVRSGWDELTASPLPNQSDLATVKVERDQHRGPTMTSGKLVPIDTPMNASGFRHRTEMVYLPPAWFDSTTGAQLPVIMMIGGEFNTPTDWIRRGGAVETADNFARHHHGNAPVLVFVDAGGSFNNDTECVNGKRGNVADHFTKEVLPFVISHFNVSPKPENWGVAGWSTGGLCAVTLAVKHPELFSAFDDIAGDMSPNTGTKAQTISRLFGGNKQAWDDFDPATIMARHGKYSNTVGWFDVDGVRQGSGALTSSGAIPGAAAPFRASALDIAAQKLCAIGTAEGILCTVQYRPGQHRWPFAQAAFAAALPWMAGQIGTPAVPRIPLPK